MHLHFMNTVHFTGMQISIMLFAVFGLFAVFRNRRGRKAVATIVVDRSTLRVSNR